MLQRLGWSASRSGVLEREYVVGWWWDVLLPCRMQVVAFSLCLSQLNSPLSRLSLSLPSGLVGNRPTSLHLAMPPTR